MKQNPRTIILPPAGTPLLDEIAVLIEQGRNQIAAHANSTLILLYWQIGKRINTDILKNERAGYGKQIVSALPTELLSPSLPSIRAF